MCRWDEATTIDKEFVMLTSNRGLVAASLFAGLALSATPALAETAESAAADLAIAAEPVLPESVNRAEGESEFELSGNVSLVSDYRFRGVSFSDGDPALQGGIDLAHSSGFYIGTWGSTISGGTPYGELEVDLYGGWSGDVSDGVSFDIGLLYYVYPTENELANALDFDTDYFEPYASIGTTLGPVSATLGVAYAWDQASLGDQDNFYISTDFEAGIPNTPLTLTAHAGYTDGVFATQADGTSFDWGLGASYAVTDSLSLGVNYVDTQGPAIEDFTDAGIFFTIGYSM
jgi:uncharacterized protein (TIGR02001 family)